MKKPFMLIALSCVVWLIADTRVHAQDGKEMTLEGQVKIGIHKFKLDEESLYQFEVKGKAFRPNVSMIGHSLPNFAVFLKEPNTWRGFFAPPKSAEYTLAILPTFAQVAELDYTVKWRALKLAEAAVLKKEDKLTDNDPKYANPKYSSYKGPFKEYPIKLKAGGIYLFEMTATKAEGNKLLPFILLETSNGQIAAQDLANPRSRFVYRPVADGEFRVIAATSYLTSLGAYTLTIRTVQEDKE